jgi:magnesium-transporting ATPase (P-type)
VTNGLTSAEAAASLEQFGANEMPAPARPAAWRQMLAQLTHFFAIMLWVAAGLALLAGLPALAVAITVIVVLNGVFAFVQEHRADRATEKLGELMPALARVRRNGRTHTVAVGDVVPGDLVLLSAGDRVPADLTLQASHDLALDESMLTGESVPVRATAGEAAHAGTFVVLGDGEGVVTRTGSRTGLAQMAALTEHADRPPSPLDLELQRLVRAIAIVAIGVGLSLATIALVLDSTVTAALIFGVGVTVALVPEGLLPTVTLSLARGAQRMAGQQALVRHLQAVETLGATTFICTDKTGTLTRNEMAVVEVWTPVGSAVPRGVGYEPVGTVTGTQDAIRITTEAARAARACVTGRAVGKQGEWVPDGDPMEVALDVLAGRLGCDDIPPTARVAFASERMWSAATLGDRHYILGAPEVVLARCRGSVAEATEALNGFADAGQRVVAVARARPCPRSDDPEAGLRRVVEGDLDLLALVVIEDPPRDGVLDALRTCRAAGIRVAMMTGDNERTAAAIAREVGLLLPGGVVIEGVDLPTDDRELADLLDNPGGAVVARVTPADKLRIARSLRRHGHVVAMTGDGVNDAAALRGADVGVAMGRTGSDVARQAADLVLLDDHFATIVSAIQLGRATYANIRRFLTFHLTDNVAELTPFALWALSGGSVPPAIGVLQVLALDIGTDMLPALALGDEPASPRTMQGARRGQKVASGAALRRAFLVLGPVEAVMAVSGFLWVLHRGGWTVGGSVPADLLASASGTAFAAIAVGQAANAFACRSETRTAWRLNPLANRLVLWAVAAELALLVTFLGVPAFSELLGGTWPPVEGWLWAAATGGAVVAADATHKRARRTRSRNAPPSGRTSRLVVSDGRTEGLPDGATSNEEYLGRRPPGGTSDPEETHAHEDLARGHLPVRARRPHAG